VIQSLPQRRYPSRMYLRYTRNPTILVSHSTDTVSDDSNPATGTAGVYQFPLSQMSSHLPTARNVQVGQTRGKGCSRLSPHATTILEKSFHDNPRPSIASRETLAGQLGLPTYTVNVSRRRAIPLHLLILLQNWFQNRRSKTKQSEKSSSNPMAITSITNS
jgi:hypothetical protein